MSRSTRLYLGIGFLGSLLFAATHAQAQPGNPFPPDCKFPPQPPGKFVVSQLIPVPLGASGGSPIPPRFDDPLPVPLPAVPAPSAFNTPKPLPDVVPPKASKPLPLPAAPMTLVGPHPKPLPAQPRDSALHDETKQVPGVPVPQWNAIPNPDIKKTGFHPALGATVPPLPVDPFTYPLPSKPLGSNPDPLAHGGKVPDISSPPVPPFAPVPGLNPVGPPAPPAVAKDPQPPVATSPWVVRVEVINSMTHLIARGKNTEFRVVCQNLKMQSPSGDISAEGAITITVAGLEVSCNRLVLNWQDEWVTMDGDVRLHTQKDGQNVELRGNQLRLRLNTLTAASASNDPQGFLLKTAFFRPGTTQEQTPSRVLYQSPLQNRNP